MFQTPFANGQESSEEMEVEDYDDENNQPEETCKKSIFNLLNSFITDTLACLGGKLQLNSIFELGTRFYVIQLFSTSKLEFVITLLNRNSFLFIVHC